VWGKTRKGSTCELQRGDGACDNSNIRSHLWKKESSPWRNPRLGGRFRVTMSALTEVFFRGNKNRTTKDVFHNKAGRKTFADRLSYKHSVRIK